MMEELSYEKIVGKYTFVCKENKELEKILKELRDTYDIAMQEISRLRKLLGYDSSKDKEEQN